MTKKEKLTIAIEAIKKELHLLMKDGVINEHGVEMLHGNNLLSVLERRKGEPNKKKLSEITREFRKTLWVGARKFKNDFSLFWKDWKDERGLLTRDAYGKIQPDGGPHWRLNNNMWRAFERLKDVLESLIEYFESVEKYNEDYTDIGICLQIKTMDNSRISYILDQARQELQALKWDEPLEENEEEEKP